MKVSPDGTTFYEGIVIDKDAGAVSFPNSSISGSGDASGDAIDADIIPVADGTRDLAHYDNTNSAFLTAVEPDDIAITSELQGDILYRGASGWQWLAAGKSGQFLKTLGTGADPSRDTLAGGGDMLASNNLSDVANAATAVANLDLTPTSYGKGASHVGLEDSAGNTTETDVEAAIAELYSLIGSSVGSSVLPHIQDKKSSGIDGGTFTSGADRTRDLNTGHQ